MGSMPNKEWRAANPERSRETGREQMRQWRAGNRGRDREIQRRSRKAHKERVKARLAELKNNSACVDCGVRYPHYVLDFDHLSDKRKNVSAMARDGYSWATIEQEIAKCELVCANCHRIRTHRR